MGLFLSWSMKRRREEGRKGGDGRDGIDGTDGVARRGEWGFVWSWQSLGNPGIVMSKIYRTAKEEKLYLYNILISSIELLDSLLLLSSYYIHLLDYSDMSISRLSPLRYAGRKTHSPCLRGIQRRHAQVHDVRFLVTHRQPDNMIEEKYKEKLHQKAKRSVLSFSSLTSLSI